MFSYCRRVHQCLSKSDVYSLTGQAPSKAQDSRIFFIFKRGWIGGKPFIDIDTSLGWSVHPMGHHHQRHTALMRTGVVVRVKRGGEPQQTTMKQSYLLVGRWTREARKVQIQQLRVHASGLFTGGDQTDAPSSRAADTCSPSGIVPRFSDITL